MSKSLKKLIDINRLREFKNKLVGTGSAYVQTAAVDQTIAGTKTFSKPIVGSVTGSSGSCTGNSATATTATSVPWSGVTGKPSSYTPAAHTQAASTITGLAKVATSGSYTDLANKPAIPTVNNATLTIQKNGTTVKTFTANASANVTANITVPTKVSELTNDSGFLTGHQSLSNYVTLNGAQTISGAKTFTGNIIGINKDNSTEDANSLYSTTAGSKLTYYTTSNGGTKLANVPAAVNTTLESRTIRRLSDSDRIVEQICHNSNGLYYRKGGNGTWGAWKTFAFTDSNISGNAATATKLQTARTINGTSFNGTANITTANWGTARNITITDGTNTSTAVSVNGSANVALKLPATIKANLTGNAATATTATTAKACTGNAATATNATYANWLRTSSHTDHLFHTEWDNAGYFWTYVTAGNGDYRAVRVARSDTSGNADTATKATQDAAGNTITTTYATKAENNTKANDSDVVHKSGDETINGFKTFTSEIVCASVHAFRHIVGEYGVFWRHDGTNLYLMLTNSGDQYGGWNDFRPLVVNLATGICSINGNANSAGSAGSATNATYANWLRTSSHSDHLFHTDWDNAGYFWTYVTTGTGEYRAVRVARSDSSGKADTATKAANADHATNADSATRATSADRASAANCVISNSRDYHEIRFDWDSQVSGYVGLRVDETDMGGIVTTAQVSSAIRAQWYAAYPDGPEAHNAMWGGRDITAAFNNGTVSANIANGTFRDIFPGDYITKQVTISGTAYTVNWVVADCDYWINKGETHLGMATHHVAIVPQQPIFEARMNQTSTTEGGYAGSEMFKKIIPACATGIVNAFGNDHILTFEDGVTTTVDTALISGNNPYWPGATVWWGNSVLVQCNLMCEAMVYDGVRTASSASDNIMATRQMSAFRLSERLINYNRQWWWLRDVVSSVVFATVGGGGLAGAFHASTVRGVRPFALLR